MPPPTGPAPGPAPALGPPSPPGLVIELVCAGIGAGPGTGPAGLGCTCAGLGVFGISPPGGANTGGDIIGGVVSGAGALVGPPPTGCGGDPIPAAPGPPTSPGICCGGEKIGGVAPPLAGAGVFTTGSASVSGFLIGGVCPGGVNMICLASCLRSGTPVRELKPTPLDTQRAAASVAECDAFTSDAC